MKVFFRTVSVFAVALSLFGQIALAQAPPSGEPPRRPSAEEMAKKREAARQPVLSLETRDKILAGLYEKLRTEKDKSNIGEILIAIRQASFFSGSPTTDLLLNRAAQAIKAKDTPLAQKFIDTALELQPDSYRAYNMRALAYSMQNDHGRAIDDYRRAIALDPKNYMPFAGLADEYAKQNMTKESIDAYTELEKRFPLFRDTPDYNQVPEPERNDNNQQGI